MGKKSIRKQINSLQKQIAEHEAKIANEMRKPEPDDGKIRHWQKEIEAFKKGIEKANRRLRRKT